MKRFICLALCLLFVSGGLAACSEKDAASDSAPAASSDPAAAEESPAPAEEPEDPMKDNLPDADFGGYAFRIGAANENNADYLRYLYVEEMTGETVNDAVYTANDTVRNRFNVDLTWAEVSDSHFNMYQHVVNAVKAGDDVFDAAILHDHASVTAMLEGALLNLHTLPDIDTSKPWWPEFTVKALTVNGKLYFACSSLKYDALASTRAVFINREIAEELNLALPYDMVRAGTWTMDVMKDMSSKAFST